MHAALICGRVLKGSVHGAFEWKFLHGSNHPNTPKYVLQDLRRYPTYLLCLFYSA